jgi:hypothetical protein
MLIKKHDKSDIVELEDGSLDLAGRCCFDPELAADY